jgi:hypothetical protein
VKKEPGASRRIRRRLPGQTMMSRTYADLFDDDLDAVAANLDAAIKSAAYPQRTGHHSVNAD